MEEFLRGFSVHAGCNLHVEILYGRDVHHLAESVFKGLAKAVDQAGAFCIVVEGVIEDIATEITRAVSAPVIGIGASAMRFHIASEPSK